MSGMSVTSFEILHAERGAALRKLTESFFFQFVFVCKSKLN